MLNSVQDVASLLVATGMFMACLGVGVMAAAIGFNAFRAPASKKIAKLRDALRVHDAARYGETQETCAAVLEAAREVVK
jgi:hypothetical protein